LGAAVPVDISRTAELGITTTDTDSITYRASNTFTNATSLDGMVNTINYEGLNLWWQMQNLPDFLKSWQSFSQIMNKFYSQNFESFFYAHVMFPTPFF
jgi:hypothetical protein